MQKFLLGLLFAGALNGSVDQLASALDLISKKLEEQKQKLALDLWEAVREEDFNKVKQLLEKGADPNIISKYRMNSLYRAVITDNTKIVKLILMPKYKANPNIGNHIGMTPLHRADDTEIAKLLLDNGANIKVKDKYGETPLHSVGRHSDPIKMAKFLLENSATKDIIEIDAQNNKGETLLHLAVMENQTEVVRLLLEKGSYPFIENNAGKNPIALNRDMVSGKDRDAIYLLFKTWIEEYQ